jgi:outer membrane protein OmpA-like peptidoglycan-associated protein
MMAGLMMVFLFISVSYAFQVTNQAVELEVQTERISEIVGEYQDHRRLIYTDLVGKFGDRLDGWDAEIDEDTLAFRFRNPAVLFQPGSADITPAFAEILQEFWPDYINIMIKYDSVIREVRIEGHTSSEWTGTSIDESYFNNMTLSQSRTRTALEKCYWYTPMSNLVWVRSTVTANGMSFSRLVVDDRGQEDPQRSRRVEFTVVVDSKKKLDEISREL